MFLPSFPDGPGGFPYVFLIAVKVVTLVAVDYSTFVVPGVLVFWFHKCLFDSGITSEMNLYTILTTYLFDAFAYSFCVWDYNLTYCVFVDPNGAVLIVVWLFVLCCAAVFVPCLCSCVLTIIVVVICCCYYSP